MNVKITPFSPDPHQGLTRNKSVDHLHVSQGYSQNPVFEENQCQSVSNDSDQVFDYNTREPCSLDNELSSDLMYTCAKSNIKVFVSQQVPADTRARRLCGGTSLQASSNSTNRGDGLVKTNTNTNTLAPGMSVSHANFQCSKANTTVGQVEQHHKAASNKTHQTHVKTMRYDQVNSLCKVQFTRWELYNVYNQKTHVVFITNYDTGVSMWTYYWQGYCPHKKFVQPCYQVPPGPLHIEDSIDMYIMWPNSVNSVARENADPALVFSNYTKDCFYNELYNLTYEEYMVSVIDQLIVYQDQLCQSRRPLQAASKISRTNVCSNQLIQSRHTVLSLQRSKLTLRHTMTKTEPLLSLPIFTSPTNAGVFYC